VPKELLQPWQIAKVRDHNVEYGDVREATTRRAAFCRCCGQPVAKGEPALNFYWDFNGNGSWTAQSCYMHPACEPAPEAVREANNLAALIATKERLLAKLDDQWDRTSGRKAGDRLERQIKYLEESLRSLRALTKRSN
jgi:hypothetical protein